MTYQMLWAFRLPDGRPQLGVITNSRTGIKPMKELFGMIDGKGVDHFFQRFRIQAIRISLRPGEYFFGYKYFAVDNSDMSEAEGDSYKALHERFRKAGFSTSMADEADVSSQPIKTFDSARRTLDKERFRFENSQGWQRAHFRCPRNLDGGRGAHCESDALSRRARFKHSDQKRLRHDCFWAPVRPGAHP